MTCFLHCRYKERRLLKGNHFEIFSGNGENPGAWTLLIHETFPEDAGYYLAKATNAAGSAITEAKLIVEGECRFLLVVFVCVVVFFKTKIRGKT